MEIMMSDSVEKKKGPAEAGEAKGAGADVEALVNSLRLEREKNEVLLAEVVALEDELVNRQLGDFAGVISEHTKDFWREQLLSNRDAAASALEELREAKLAAEGVKAAGTDTKRPLHNRESARMVTRRGLVGQDVVAGAGDANAESKAVRIRNRAQELCKAERIPFSTAFQRAEKEICGEDVR